MSILNNCSQQKKSPRAGRFKLALVWVSFDTSQKGFAHVFLSDGVEAKMRQLLDQHINLRPFGPRTICSFLSKHISCHSVLWAGIKAAWWSFRRRPQWPFPCGPFSTATWECEETKRRPHMEVTQLFLPSYVVHTSVTHIREGCCQTPVDQLMSQVSIYAQIIRWIFT